MALIYPLGLGAADFSDGSTSVGYESDDNAYGGRITIPSSGTVTQLGCKTSTTTGGPHGLKFALLTTGGTLVAQSTGNSQASGPGLDWVNSGAMSASVSAGDYIVLVSAASNTVLYGWDSAGDGSYAVRAYASAFQATETLFLEAETGTMFGVRLDFTAGGGGVVIPKFINQYRRRH